MANATIEYVGGTPAIVVDGKPIPPTAMTTPIVDEDYLRSLGKAGTNVYFISCTTRWHSWGEEEWTDEAYVKHANLDGIEKFRADAEKLLELVPDALILLRLNISPSRAWVNAHPDDMLLYNDGKHYPMICTSVGRVPVDGMHSLCSDAFRHDAAEAIREYLREFDTFPFADRIIGIFLGCAGTLEWYYPEGNFITDYEKGIYADFSPAFKKEYTRFLHKKYATVEDLRRAWADPTATFEEPKIPNMEDRGFIMVDDIILDAMASTESANRQLDHAIDPDAKGENNVGVFLNVNKYQFVADFFQALNEGTANTIVELAGVVKEVKPNMLTGAFYGALGCTDYFNFGTATGTLTVLNSGVVDFLAAPGTYNNREPGGHMTEREMQDSFLLRKMIFVSEDDTRTHRENEFYRDGFGLYDIEDSLTVLKRAFARNLCEETYAWWLDQHRPNGGRYKDPAIYDLFKRMREVGDYAYSLGREKHNDIAMIYDLESINYVSVNTSTMLLDWYRTSDLMRIGAPVDWYYHNDMERPDMPDYKLYVMINVFCLTDAEREAIHAKARKNGATILWLYAPGFINPDGTTAMSLENIEKVTGMKLGGFDKTTSPKFRVDTASPLLRYADPDRKYGFIDRDVHSNVWLGSVFAPPKVRSLPAPFMNPGFYIDDPDATVLGRYCNSGKAALAMKKADGFVSVYCAPQIARSELIASIAEWSGAHIFSHDDDVLYANENFVTVHAHSTGKRKISFKKPCSPFEVFEKKVYGENVTELEIEMKLGETKMFSLHGEW